jgi:hypothetical protein
MAATPDGREWAFSDVASADLKLVEHRILDGRVLVDASLGVSSD